MLVLIKRSMFVESQKMKPTVSRWLVFQCGGSAALRVDRFLKKYMNGVYHPAGKLLNPKDRRIPERCIEENVKKLTMMNPNLEKALHDALVEYKSALDLLLKTESHPNIDYAFSVIIESEQIINVFQKLYHDVERQQLLDETIQNKVNKLLSKDELIGKIRNCFMDSFLNKATCSLFVLLLKEYTKVFMALRAREKAKFLDPFSNKS